MIRGTTPKFTYTFKTSVDFIKDFRWTFAQEGKKIVEKKFDDVEKSENEISCRLSQEDTLAFVAGIDAEIKLRILTNGNEVLSTDTSVEKVEETFNEEILK